MPEEAAAPSKPAESADVPDLITQADEQTVAVERKTESKKKEVKRTEKTAAEKAAEARKLAEAEAERERKAAAELASKRVAGAFGKGVGMGSVITSYSIHYTKLYDVCRVCFSAQPKCWLHQAVQRVLLFCLADFSPQIN